MLLLSGRIVSTGLEHDVQPPGIISIDWGHYHHQEYWSLAPLAHSYARWETFVIGDLAKGCKIKLQIQMCSTVTCCKKHLSSVSYFSYCIWNTLKMSWFSYYILYFLNHNVLIPLQLSIIMCSIRCQLLIV